MTAHQDETKILRQESLNSSVLFAINPSWKFIFCRRITVRRLKGDFTMTPDRVIPLLVYRDIHSAYDFLINAFGCKPGFVHESPDGDAIHGEVHVGDTTIWLHRVTAEHALASPETVDMAGAGLVIHGPDVDVHYARAQAAGARIDNEPIDRPYGQREFRKFHA